MLKEPMKEIKICFALLLFVFIAYSQEKQPTMSFISEEHDFGDINEEKGKVTYTFEFKNVGTLPVVIYDIKPTCGCTASEWSKEPVLPGEKGIIKATFDPARRPGNFNKGIIVKSNASNGMVVLRIKGNVIPKSLTNEDIYPHLSGNLRFKSSNMSFASIIYNQSKTQVFDVLNISDQPVEVSFKSIPKHLTIKCLPSVLKPKQKGEISITYDPVIKNDWDFVIDRLYLLQNGEEFDNNKFTVSATIIEDFSGLSGEDSLNAPVIQFESTVFDFGIIKQSEKAEYTYKFSNIGNSDLIIRKVKASCGCTAIEPAETVIKPGKTSFIKVVFNGSSQKNQQNKTVIVITNDPVNSKTLLKIKGYVE